jgi:hypothetical protein
MPLRATGVMLRPIVIAAALALSIPNGLSAAAPAATRTSAEPIFAAAAIAATKKPKVRRCGGYTVTTALYTGNSNSTDARMAGRMTFAGRIAVNSGGSAGVATGQFLVRDRQRRIRMQANLRGVVTQGVTVNGVVMGTVSRPAARLMANVTIVFDEVLRFGAVRLGLETGLNSAVAYPAVPNCR